MLTLTLSDCKDIDYNIKTGASYFAQQLKDNDNNVFLALGTYNGWYKGLTTEKATAVQNTPNCFNQNNLDYLYQMVNGWLQGKDGHKLGKIRELNIQVLGKTRWADGQETSTSVRERRTELARLPASLLDLPDFPGLVDIRHHLSSLRPFSFLHPHIS